MRPTWPALLAVAVLAALHLSAGSILPVTGRPSRRWLSLAGGITVAYVFMHILPDLAERQAQYLELRPDRPLQWLEHQVYVGALLGVLVAYGLDRVSLGSHRTRFWVRIASFALYNAIVGYHVARIHRPVALVLATVAFGAHFIVNDRTLRHEEAERYVGRGRWALAGAVVLGGLAGLLGKLPEIMLAALDALLAGGIILHALNEEVPAEREGNFSWFAAGAVGYAGLILATVAAAG